jgi:hypothetical protein
MSHICDASKCWCLIWRVPFDWRQARADFAIIWYERAYCIAFITTELRKLYISYSSKRNLHMKIKAAILNKNSGYAQWSVMNIFIHCDLDQNITCKQDKKLMVASILLKMEKCRLYAALSNFFPYDHFCTKMDNFFKKK